MYRHPDVQTYGHTHRRKGEREQDRGGEERGRGRRREVGGIDLKR